MAERFVHAFGRPPEVTWAAPGRVNLIGEHTDYNAGFVLPFALPQRTVVAAAHRPDRVLACRSRQRPDEPVELAVDELRPGGRPTWGAYPAGVVWALADAGHQAGGASLLVDGAVPIGAGLASSAALECAVACGLNQLFGFGIPRRELVGLCVRAENAFVGMPCGVMDQLAAIECRAGAALWVDARSLATRPVALPLDAAGLTMLVVDTGVRHELVGSAYADRRRQCERAARVLGVGSLREATVEDLGGLPAGLRARARHVVTENARVAEAVGVLQSGRVAELGPLLDASHRSLRDDFEVSCPELDLAVEAARAAGALGGRMTGAGFGGCAIALAPAAQADEIGRAVAAAFAVAGFRPPSTFRAAPSAGAGPAEG
jgi:galactokinase